MEMDITVSTHYQVERGKCWKIGLSPSVEAVFVRLYPVTMNVELKRLFRVSYNTIARLSAQYGLEKDKDAIKKAFCERMKQTNGVDANYLNKLKREEPEMYDIVREKISAKKGHSL